MAGPQFIGTHVSSTIDMTPVMPFAGVTLSDPGTPNATELVTIQRFGQGGTLADGSDYSGPHTLRITYDFREQEYTIEGPLAQVNQELNALSFVPNSGQIGTTGSTTLMLSDASSSGSNSGNVPDSGTVVYNTTTRDEVSISQQVSYAHGVFTLAGYASQAAGITSVEITATLGNGSVKDLGAATVNADGTFTFSDVIGRHTQSFITATATSGIGAGVKGAAPFSLTGGLGPNGGAAEQDRYNADGSAQTATDLFKPSGSQNVAVQAAGQTFVSSSFDTFNNGGAPLSTFVFDPGFGRDVVSLFRAGGDDHDFLSFKGSDFGATPADQLASVLSHSRDTAAGLLITDPTASSPGGGPGSHDKVLLKDITKDQLSANTADIAFHA